MVKSCRFDWTLCAVLNRWNLRVARTLQHRLRSYLILQKINQKFVVGRIIGKQCLAILGFGLCTVGRFWGGVPQFVLTEINGDVLSFWLDALCCAEPVKPESGQNTTTQTKVLLTSPKNNNKKFVVGRITGKRCLAILGFGVCKGGRFWINNVNVI